MGQNDLDLVRKIKLFISISLGLKYQTPGPYSTRFRVRRKTGVHRSFIVNTMRKMSTGLQPDQGSDHMLPTGTGQAEGSKRGDAQGARQTSAAKRTGPTGDPRSGGRRTRVARGGRQCRGGSRREPKRGAVGPTAAGFGTEAPSLFICLMVCIIRRDGYFASPQTWS